MTELESARNPLVGPSSYSPNLLVKNQSEAIPWAKMSPRFKDEDSKEDAKSPSQISNLDNLKIQKQTIGTLKLKLKSQEDPIVKRNERSKGVETRFQDKT